MYFARSGSEGCASRISSSRMGWTINDAAIVTSIEVESDDASAMIMKEVQLSYILDQLMLLGDQSRKVHATLTTQGVSHYIGLVWVIKDLELIILHQL
jgi:precorrin-6B methylase 1